MLQQLHRPAQNQRGGRERGELLVRVPAYSTLVGAPDNWKLDPAGAVAYVTDWEPVRLFRPDALQSITLARNDCVIGKVPVEVDGFANSWNDFWRRGLQNKRPSSTTSSYPLRTVAQAPHGPYVGWLWLSMCSSRRHQSACRRASSTGSPRP